MLDNKQRIEKLEEEKYQELFGVKKATFFKLLEILEKAYMQLHSRGGKPPKLSVLDKLVITLCYYREYRTMQHIAFDYGVVKSAICDAVHWVENVLIKQDEFHLPGKKKLLESNNDIKTILIDATEHEIERPKKKQKKWYSGKKKKHTLKTQIIADAQTLSIIAIAKANGKTHDFQLFKNSKSAINKAIKAKLDSGYQGICKIHANSEIPKKKTKKEPLSEKDKQQNKRLSSERIYIEHINRKIKRFKILSIRYRSHRKYHGLRVSLICGLYNYELIG